MLNAVGRMAACGRIPRPVGYRRTNLHPRTWWTCLTSVKGQQKRSTRTTRLEDLWRLSQSIPPSDRQRKAMHREPELVIDAFRRRARSDDGNLGGLFRFECHLLAHLGHNA